jgi:hypothetical protein
MTPGELREMYREEIAEHGKSVLVRRYSGTGASRTPTDVTVRVRVSGYRAERIAGTIREGDQNVILLAEDIEGTANDPVRVGDKIVDSGKELNIEAVDRSTRAVAGTLIAYDLQVRG